MRLAQTDFVVLAEDAGDGEETEIEDSFEVEVDGEPSEGEDNPFEVSEDTDDEFEIEKSDEETDEEAEIEEIGVDWPELFGSIEGSTVDFADMSKDAADEIKAMIRNLPKEDPLTKPYSIMPEAAVKDSVEMYDENDPRLKASFAYLESRVDAGSRILASHIRRILHVESMARQVRDQRRGSLDKRKLHTLNVPGQVRPSKNVFEKTVKGKSHNVAIAILVDQSGSMVGPKITTAQEAALVFGDALESVAGLGVQFGVWGFDTKYAGRKNSIEIHDRAEPIRMHEFKTFPESWRRVRTRCAAIRADGNNVDGESLRWVAQQLLPVKADRKIIIVISDGQPLACSSHLNQTIGYKRQADDLTLAIKQVEEAGIEVGGVGLMSFAVRDFYKKHVLIHRAADLSVGLVKFVADYFGIKS
jgi:cobalamin biosynthesis protein CobT